MRPLYLKINQFRNQRKDDIMNNIVVSNNIKIENMIYEIRGKKVMLDSDLAKLYNVETKRINEAVKNNIEKFPERYCFKLSDNESDNLLVEIFDQKIEKRGGKYKNPRVFTEQGVYMLATILKSKEATKITIAIMDAFIVMKKIINTNIFHDRFIIIDNKMLYHSGASFKDLGKKCFAITKIVDNNILEELLDKLEK